jgi:ectoine hydroxylase-related dioxygenase (phytanoyl-CoA dioxygenase family)
MSAATIAADRQVQPLSDAQRDALLVDLDRDGYAVLPDLLPRTMIDAGIAAIDRLSAQARRESPGQRAVKLDNCVDRDPALRSLMMYEPALQLAHDVFGPMFHLSQSNCISRPGEPAAPADFISSSPWHADGPRPGQFPTVGGVMGLHYLKFGYFHTDLRHDGGGALQVVRGSHKRPELDGRKGRFRIDEHARDVVTFACRPGTVVAFHQAQWHAAEGNRSAIERKNCYLSYCPTWMRPFDREAPTSQQLAGLSGEERWLLGEPRPAKRWWLPQGDDVERLARYRRNSQAAPSVAAYD